MLHDLTNDLTKVHNLLHSTCEEWADSGLPMDGRGHREATRCCPSWLVIIRFRQTLVPGSLMKDFTYPFSGTLHEVLGMRLLPSTSPEELRAEMPVGLSVCQPFGFLSGGASMALAETLAGFGSMALCGGEEVPMGIQVSANHVHAVPLGGKVCATARLLSRSRRIQVWNVDITDEEGRLVSTCRVTNCITTRKAL